MTNQELAVRIIDLVGGEDNILRVEHCMTRLRIEVRDNTIFRSDELKHLEGVLGLVEEGNYKQIVVGPGKSKKLCDLVTEKVGLDDETNDWAANKEQFKSQQKKSGFKVFLKVIGEIFVPLIPAIIAAGIFNGFAGLITNLQAGGTLPVEGGFEITKQIFSLIGGGFLSYFAIFTGDNAARKFGATPALGGMLGAMSIMPGINTISTIFGMYNEASPLDSILTTGKGGVIGVIIGVYILAKIEKAVRKHVPDVLDLIVTPMITLLVTTIAFVLVIMPLSGFASDGLVAVLSLLINSSNPIINIISGYVLSALFLPMVLLGLHHGLIPIYALQLEQMGGVSLFPVLAMAGAGQVGAAVAIYLKAKRVNNQRLISVIAGALPAGVLGIGEPLIYGVTLPLGKPFVTAGLGAGFGGAYVMATNVMASSWGPSGIVAIPLMHPDSILNFILGILISYVGGFIVTQLFIKESDIINK